MWNWIKKNKWGICLFLLGIGIATISIINYLKEDDLMEFYITTFLVVMLIIAFIMDSKEKHKEKSEIEKKIDTKKDDDEGYGDYGSGKTGIS